MATIEVCDISTVIKSISYNSSFTKDEVKIEYVIKLAKDECPSNLQGVMTHLEKHLRPNYWYDTLMKLIENGQKDVSEMSQDELDTQDLISEIIGHFIHTVLGKDIKVYRNGVEIGLIKEDDELTVQTKPILISDEGDSLVDKVGVSTPEDKKPNNYRERLNDLKAVWTPAFFDKVIQIILDLMDKGLNEYVNKPTVIPPTEFNKISVGEENESSVNDTHT